MGQARTAGKAKDSIRRGVLRVALVIAQVSLVLALLAAGFTSYRAWQTWSEFPTQAGRSDSVKRVGVIAGHLDSDSGAVCPDGLREVDINQDIVERVVGMLQSLGYEAEILAEYDDTLTNYQADALISIHSDSCLPDRSGFKVARVVNSTIPEQEDRLVACLYQEYERATGLARDEATITVDMTEYHAFSVIAADTPGAIVELGFMGGDRELLTKRPAIPARGIVAGIVCFLEPATPAP